MSSKPASPTYSSPQGISYRPYAGERDLPDIINLVQTELSEPYVVYTYRYFLQGWPQLSFLAFPEQAQPPTNPKGREKDPKPVGAIVCKQSFHKYSARRGYIAMLSVSPSWRKMGIGALDPPVLAQGALITLIRDPLLPIHLPDMADATKSVTWDRQLGARAELELMNVLLSRLAASTLVKLSIERMVQTGADEVILETEVDNTAALGLYASLGFIREKRLFRFYMNGKDAFRLVLPLPMAPSITSMPWEPLLLNPENFASHSGSASPMPLHRDIRRALNATQSPTSTPPTDDEPDSVMSGAKSRIWRVPAMEALRYSDDEGSDEGWFESGR